MHVQAQELREQNKNVLETDETVQQPEQQKQQQQEDAGQSQPQEEERLRFMVSLGREA
jgi:hypothetical protein